MKKIHLEKALDKIEWSFSRHTLQCFNFLEKLSNLIMFSISSSQSSILINGTRVEFFNFTRGIGQGDSMSPYIFIL